MRESQHAADHAGVLDGPSHVTDLSPAVLVFDLHHALGDGQLPPGRADDGPEPQLLHLLLVNLSLEWKRSNKNIQF